jgi:hypothetical protein
MISESISDLGSCAPNVEALLFSIYLAAVITLNDTDCLQMMNESKQTMVAKFSYASRHALQKAEFLKSTDVLILQALTLYLV